MSSRSGTRKFFLRGLAIILPTVLTIWLLVVAYQFVSDRIAKPINAGTKNLIVNFAPFPTVTEPEMQERLRDLQLMTGEQGTLLRKQYKDAPNPKQWLEQDTRRTKLNAWWQSIRIGNWVVMDVIGLIIAIVLIYIIGVLVSGFIGRRIYNRGEELIGRVPLIRRVYPSVKQVTDFFVGENNDPAAKFNRVVAVQYPRKGIWSVGLVTGSTMRDIEEKAGSPCLTVFIPSSPTPFTGYVITVPESDTLELPVTIEDALKFAVSLGVLVPANQRVDAEATLFDATAEAPTSTDTPNTPNGTDRDAR